MTDPGPTSEIRKFAPFYAIANAGAYVAFVPLLTLLLPIKAEFIAPDNKLLLLSTVLFWGAIMASLANIAAGWVSDHIFKARRNRLSQISISLPLVILSYYLFWTAESWSNLITAILIFQLSFNFLFSPLAALLADHIPHHAKGRMSALLNLGMPIGTASIALLTLPFFASEESRLITIVLIITLFTLPLLLFARSPVLIDPALIKMSADTPNSTRDSQTSMMHNLTWAWIARLTVQFSGAVMFSFILYYLQDVAQYADKFPEEKTDQGVGKLSLIATPLSIMAGLFAGYFSDKYRLRQPFLIFAALSISISIFCMTAWPSWPVILPTYVIFVAALTTFLTIDAALVSQILSDSPARAKILGFMNLTNTIPAILTPGLAIVMSYSDLNSDILTMLFQMASFLALVGAFAATRLRTVNWVMNT